MSTLCATASVAAAPSLKDSPGRLTRSRARSATPSGKNALFCKGAPESVLARCSHARLADGTL
eukprot:1846867-Pleurochrysis_carterae.AAC.1